jgi:diacylglycerol kinase family enzyme
VEFLEEGVRRQRYFVQLAGAGWDARAIELVDWSHKKKIGPLAYVIAGLKALRERQPKITVSAGGQSVTGEFVLVGNGRFYGGPVKIFPRADLRNGRLEICVFPHFNWWTLIRCAPGLLARRQLPMSLVENFQAAQFDLAGEPRTAFELDGEWVGHLPATFFVEREKLRVIVP